MSHFDANDRLKDYVDVRARIRLFYAAHPDGRLVTTDVRATSEPDGVPRVWVEACAYRSPDDPIPGRGWSWMVLPGATPYTRGSELENTETSAWGRAIGALGIGIDKSIATADEVRNKEGEADRPQPQQLDDGGLIGRAAVGNPPADFELRQDPQHEWRVSFRLMSGAKAIKVVALGSLAQALHTVKGEVIGKTVTCYGTVAEESFTPKDTKRTVRYPVLTLSRIETPDFTLPAPEAPSLPAWTPEEIAEAVGG